MHKTASIRSICGKWHAASFRMNSCIRKQWRNRKNLGRRLMFVGPKMTAPYASGRGIGRSIYSNATSRTL